MDSVNNKSSLHVHCLISLFLRCSKTGFVETNYCWHTLYIFQSNVYASLSVFGWLHIFNSSLPFPILPNGMDNYSGKKTSKCSQVFYRSSEVNFFLWILPNILEQFLCRHLWVIPFGEKGSNLSFFWTIFFLYSGGIWRFMDHSHHMENKPFIASLLSLFKYQQRKLILLSQFQSEKLTVV